MSNYDGPRIQDVYAPSGADIRTWAYSGANWPEQDWDVFMAEPQHLPLLLSLIEDPSCPARDTLLLSLYCTVGHTDRADARIAAAIETAASSTDPWLTTWARRARHVLENPADFNRDDWCGLDTFAARPVEIDEATARATAEALIASWPAPESDDDAFVIWNVEEHSRAWILAFNTRRWVRTRDIRDQAIGSCPFVVDKLTGELHRYGSGQYAEFREWRDA